MMSVMIRRSVFTGIFTISFAAALASAQTAWTLTTADFHTQSALLQGIDPAGVHVSINGVDSVVSLEQFLDITRATPASAAPAGRFLLHLSSEDRIGGDIVGIKGNDLVWKSPLLGEVALPLKRLVAIARPGVAIIPAQRREDVITLDNGDALRGLISDVANGSIVVTTDSGESKAPLASVKQVDFASTAGKAPAALTEFRVRFDDGSSVVAQSLKLASDKIELSIGKTALEPIDASHVAAVEQVNGPVSWLSSRQPAEDLYAPYYGKPRTGAARMNRSWNGIDPIRIGTEAFAHGIGVHSYSKLSWNLDGKYTTLRTRFAIESKEASDKADVTVRILLDGKTAYEQTHVRGGTLWPIVLVDLKDARQLSLEVDFGDNLDTQDRLDWIDCALLKNKPKVE